MIHDRFVQLLFGGLLLAVLIVAVAAWIVSRSLAENRQEQADELLNGSADAADFDATLERCRSRGGATEAIVSLANTADELASYGVEVAFTGPRGFVLDVTDTTTPTLQPDETTTVEVRTTADGAGQPDTRCELLGINDLGS